MYKSLWKSRLFAKKDIINATKLCHFNPKKQFILTTDASKNGLSAMLTNVNNGVETPVRHASIFFHQLLKNFFC